jgi:hypothetical protein
MDESNSAHIESYVEEKLIQIFLQLALRFGAKIMPPRMPYGMYECLGPTLV